MIHLSRKRNNNKYGAIVVNTMNTNLERVQRFWFFWLALTTALALLLSLMGWVRITAAQEPAQPSYTSAERASQALYQAVQNGNEQAILQILGGRQELASSSDDLKDKAERKQFATKYQQMHRLVRQSDGTTVLYIGAENWPFPVPLVEEKGKWRFDADAGAEEIFFRQIGENEAVAIQVCHALARAVAGDSGDSNASANVYAQTLVNAHADGRHGSANAQAAPFHGYYFRQASKDTSISEGAVVFVAYPVRYRSSGVMTFVVTSDDVVFQKDLGPNTARLANAIGKTTPDLSWQLAE